MKPLGMIQSYLPHLPATLGSDLLALGILRSVTIITWGHCKASPKCLQGVECAGPPKPQRQPFCQPQRKAAQTALHSTAICSTASQIYLPHNITEAAKKTKTKPANPLSCL